MRSASTRWRSSSPPLRAIRAAVGVDRVRAEDHRVHCIVRGSFEPLMKALANSHVVNLSSHEPSLEEVFLTYYRDGSDADAEALEPEVADQGGPKSSPA